MSTAFQTWAEDPASSSEGVHLLELRPRLQVTGWTATAGKNNVWEVEFSNLYGPPGAQSYRSIYAVRENGSLLTERTSVDDVETYSESWYWDEANGKLYMQGAAGNPDVEDSILAVELLTRFGTTYKTFGDYVYEGRLQSSSVQPITIRGIDFLGGFNPPSQGSLLRLNNSDALFDELDYLSAFSGVRARLLFGGGDLVYDDYQTVFTGSIEKSILSDDYLSLQTRPLAMEFRGRVPITTYTREIYPDIDKKLYGKPLPLLIGRDLIKPAKMQSKNADWYCRFRGGAYAKISDENQTGLDITNDLTIWWKGRTPIGLDVAWRHLINKFKAGQKSWGSRIHPNGDIELMLSSDGSSSYSLVATGAFRIGSIEEILVTYSCSEQKGHIFLNGHELKTTSTGTAPGSIYNGTSAIAFCIRDGASDTIDYDFFEAVIANSYSPSGSKPNNPDEIAGWWQFIQGLQDKSGNNNHLVSYGLTGHDFVNVGGVNPVTQGVDQNGTDEYFYISDADQTGLDITGALTIEVQLIPKSINGTWNLVRKWNTSGNNRGFLLRINNAALGFYISTDGANSYSFTTGNILEVGQLIRIRVVFKPSEYVRFYVFDSLVYEETSGVPSSIYDNTASFLIGSTKAIISTVAIEDTAINRPGPLMDFISRWRFDTENNSPSGSNYLIIDDMGLNNLTATNLTPDDDYERVAGGDRYLLANPEQSVSLHKVEIGDVLLEEDTDYEFDSDSNELEIWSDHMGILSVDASGVQVGDFPGGITGRQNSDVADRGADALRYFLQVVKGFEDDVMDVDSFDQVRIDTKPVSLYLTSFVSLANLVYRLCLSGSLLDLVIDEKIRLRKYEPNLTDYTTVEKHEIRGWNQPENVNNLFHKVQAKYGNSLVRDQMGEKSLIAEYSNDRVLAIHQREKIKTVETYLMREEDARLLASRLAFLASKLPVACEFELPNLRLTTATPGDTLLITRSRAGGPGGGLDGYPIVIREIKRNTSSGTVSIKGDDWSGVLGRTAFFVEDGHSDYDSCSLMERITGGFIKTATAAQKEGQLIY